MSIIELIEQLKAMPEKMEGFNSEVELVVLNTHKLSESLKKSLRNCDVGTAEEQAERFQWFCDTRPCDRCTLKNKGSAIHDCTIHWAQMPYEEGVANGK